MNGASEHAATTRTDRRAGLSAAVRRQRRSPLQTAALAMLIAMLIVAVGTGFADAAERVTPAETDSVSLSDDSQSVVASREASDAPVSFQNEIRPLLARRCFACHGPDESAGSLNLTSFEGATGPTDSEMPAVVPGDIETSELIVRINAHEEGYRMPEGEEPLTADEIDLLTRWVRQGGQYDRHWGFEPVRDVQPPPPDGLSTVGVVRNEIDAFVLAKLKANGLVAAPPAERRTLVRRVYHDLTGLPPTPTEMAAALSDDRPNAYERLVDQLLDSPAYGERWARHWLDVVRFAETNSFERDGVKANAFTYRDYVIDAINNDLPYDRFLLEQLAGDELPQPSASQLAATGFLRLGLWDDEPADPELHLFDQYDDIVRTVSEGMLGLTVGCARCHDHKIDPIPQADYYAMVAAFRGLPPFAERHNTAKYNQLETTSPEAKQRHRQLDDEIEAVRREMHAIEQEGIVKMSAPMQRASEGPRRPKILKQLRRFLSDERWAEYSALIQRKRTLEESRGSLPPRTFVLGVADVDPTPPETFLLERGNPSSPAERVAPGVPQLFGGSELSVADAAAGAASSKRRLALAEWLASNPNGAVARVAVNRIWQHHFGHGLVRSANNFGQLGTPPSHPELLDWLAVRFVDDGWSQKAMHRLIVTSATYRMSGRYDETAAVRDPQNLLLWRFPIRRLDAEEIRDAVLSLSGSLDRSRIGGPSIYPAIPAEVRAGLSKPDEGWPTSPAEMQNRRSLYVFSKRSLPLPLFQAFDFPETDATCEGRFQTVQPAQALSLLNSDFLQKQSGRIAERLRTEAGDDPAAQIERLIERAYCRPADDDTVARLLDLHYDMLTAGDREAMRLIVLAVLNTSEFLYVD